MRFGGMWGHFKSLRLHLSTPKTRYFQTTRFQKTPPLKPFWKAFVFISVFGRCSVDDRPKRIKTFAALTENALVCMGPLTTSRANYACACENRYPRGKVTRARREGGRQVRLSPWPYLLHPSLSVGRRGKRNTLLFEKGRRHRPRWCCLSLWGEGSVTGFMLLRWLKATNCELR